MLLLRIMKKRPNTIAPERNGKNRIKQVNSSLAASNFDVKTRSVSKRIPGMPISNGEDNISNPVITGKRDISLEAYFCPSFGQTARITPDDPNPNMATDTARYAK